MASKALWRSILDNQNTSDNEKIAYILESWNSVVSDFGLDWLIINQEGDTFKTQNYTFPEMSIRALWDICSEAIGLYHEDASSLNLLNPNLTKDEKRELKDEESTLKDCQKALLKKYWNIKYTSKKSNEPPVIKVDTPPKKKVQIHVKKSKGVTLKVSEKAVDLLAEHKEGVSRFFTLNNKMDDNDLYDFAQDLYDELSSVIKKERAERSKAYGLNLSSEVKPQDVVKYIWNNVTVTTEAAVRKLFYERIFKPEYDKLIAKAIEEEKKLKTKVSKPENKTTTKTPVQSNKGQKHSVEKKKDDFDELDTKFPEPTGVRVESTIEFKVKIKSKTLDSDLLQSEISQLESLLKQDSSEGRKDEILEVLGLDTEQYLVYNRDKQTKEKPIPAYALQSIIKNPKEPFYVVRDNEGKDHYIISDADYKRVLKEKSRATEPWRVDRVLKNKRTEYSKRQQYINSNIGNRLLSEGKSEQDVINYIEALKKEWKELDKQIDRKATKNLADSREKMGREFRESMVRAAQKLNRAQLSALNFTGSVHKGKTPEVSQLFAAVMSDATSKMGKVKGNIASFGTSQELASKVFGQSGRAWKDEFNKIYGTKHRLTNTDFTEDDEIEMQRTGGNPTYKDILLDEMGQPVLRESYYWEHVIYTIPVEIKPELEIEDVYQIRAVLKPSIVKSKKAITSIRRSTVSNNMIGKNVKNEKKSVREKHEVDMGCLLAATYFYTLVSNTPVDESYRKEMVYDEDGNVISGSKKNTWSRPRFGVRDKNNHTALSPVKSEEELRKEIEEKGTKITKTHYRSAVHYPDKESVRGDWVLYFRGKTFKAYHSEPNKKGKSVNVDFYFNEDDFRNPITEDSFNAVKNTFYNKQGNIKNTTFKPYIWSIAEQIQKVVGDSNSDDYLPVVENLNPRWSILEYGRYQSEPNGPWKGTGKYGLPHGVTDKGFSYQAPMGFKRIVDAQYNAIITASAVYNKQKYGTDIGNANAYTRANRATKWNIDITKTADIDYQLKHASTFEALFAQDKTLRVQNLHDINHETVWEYIKV